VNLVVHEYNVSTSSSGLYCDQNDKLMNGAATVQ